MGGGAGVLGGTALLFGGLSSMNQRGRQRAQALRRQQALANQTASFSVDPVPLATEALFSPYHLKSLE